MTGLADCNNFFVSCERSVNPALEGKAVVVLSNNDGCAIARSNEAKRLGVRMGQPAFELRDLISSGQLIALSGNHLLYRQISLAVHSIFRRYVPVTLDYSVDESFLILDGIPSGELSAIAEEMCKACMRELHIPVTIGIATTKTLAKIIAEVSKKSGISHAVLSDEAIKRELMAKLPIGELWGIGRRLARRLYQDGVYTILNFYDRPLIWVRSRLGVNGEKSWRELHDQPCIELSHVNRILQDSISETRTFPADVDDFDYIRSRLVIYTTDCAARLRAMHGRAQAISAFLRTNRFHTERGFHTPTATVRFGQPTDNTAVLVHAAVDCLRNIFNPAFRYKRAGVVLTDITPAVAYTPSLFDMIPEPTKTDEQSAKNKENSRLLAAIDHINKDVGNIRIRIASQITPGHPGHNDGYSSSFQAPASH